MQIKMKSPIQISFLASLFIHGLFILVMSITFLETVQENQENIPFGIEVEIRPFSSSTSAKIQTKNIKTAVANSNIYKKNYHDQTEAHAHEDNHHDDASSVIGNSLSGATEGKAGSPYGSTNSISDHYIYDLKLLLEQRKVYPKTAKVLEQEGTVVVSFTINADGSFSDIHLEKPSRYSKLNEASLKLIENIKQFNPIPAELKKDKWVITVPIEYRLEG